MHAACRASHSTHPAGDCRHHAAQHTPGGQQVAPRQQGGEGGSADCPLCGVVDRLQGWVVALSPACGRHEQVGLCVAGAAGCTGEAAWRRRCRNGCCCCCSRQGPATPPPPCDPLRASLLDVSCCCRYRDTCRWQAQGWQRLLRLGWRWAGSCGVSGEQGRRAAHCNRPVVKLQTPGTHTFGSDVIGRHSGSASWARRGAACAAASGLFLCLIWPSVSGSGYDADPNHSKIHGQGGCTCGRLGCPGSPAPPAAHRAHTHTQGAPAPRPTERHLCRAAWQRGGGAMHTGGGRGSSHLLQTMPPLFYMLD